MVKQRKKAKKRSYKIGVILWIVFFILSALVVMACEFSQMVVVSKLKREEAFQHINSVKTMIDADYRLQPEIIDKIEADYDVDVTIISDNGNVISLFPDGQYFIAEEATYADQMEEIKANLDMIYQNDNSQFVLAEQFRLNGTDVYVYVTAEAQMSSYLFQHIIFQSIYLVLIILIVVTLISGLLSTYVSKPITDLTEKAKRLSEGNLNVDFHDESRVSYREITELSDTLNFAEGELSKTDQMQKELIANISHDFKTPLTMIKAYAAMIQDISGDKPEKRNKHAQIIIDEADRLASLVSDLLELSKLQAGLDHLKSSLFNLSESLKTAVGRFDYLVETQGYDLQTDIVDGVFIEADKNKIDEVLYNLIGNAVNYTGEDKHVKIRLFTENQLAHFTVTDTGNGISPEELENIWDRYYRSSETHKRPVQGTGLGLSIVKTILTAHGFAFGVQSEVGKGTTFFVDFPTKNVVDITKQ